MTQIRESNRPFQKSPVQTPPNAVLGLRLLRGWSSHYLGRVTGICDSQIRRFERTGKGLGEEKRKILAKAFEVQAWELLDPTFPEKYKEKFLNNS